MLKVKAQGLPEAMRKAGKMKGQLYDDADKAVEKASLDAVNKARELAPRRDGFLKSSINIIHKTPLTRIIGSDRPYARRQEYEHKSNRGFFRRAMFEARGNLRSLIDAAIKKIGG